LNRCTPGEESEQANNAAIPILSLLSQIRSQQMVVQLSKTLAPEAFHISKEQVPPRERNGTPPLMAGDFLTRAEFERRYHVHPEIKKAELIEGIVYMPSPVRYGNHANPHLYIDTWLGTYLIATPGVDGGNNATLRLDLKNESQPDAMLRIASQLGGRSFVTEDDYLEGSPELVVEIAASSVSYDMHPKKEVYARHGVQEYLVMQMYERKASWFVLRDGVYEELKPDTQEILRSEVFPGLWLKVDAFWANDMATVIAVLHEGLASPEHQTFVESLSHQRGK
jgi:Uma2 family endonuclease